jgi:hypothetical protein
MKKIVALVVLAMVVIGFCVAQSVNIDTQRIVGTWTQAENGWGVSAGTIWVFNANGTGTRGGVNFYYGISAGGEVRFSFWTSESRLYMAPDGTRMYLGSIMFYKNT